MRTLGNTIRKSLVIKGELSGDEDVTLEGRVDGAINLSGAALTVGRLGKVKAAIVAKSVVVAGEVRGNIKAAEEIVLQETCMVEGDLAAPSVRIARGADVRGRVHIRKPVDEVPIPPLASDNAANVSNESRVEGTPQPVQRSVKKEMPAASKRSRSLRGFADFLVGGARPPDSR